MNKDLQIINEEIEKIKNNSPSMDKYNKLGLLYICKQFYEIPCLSTKNSLTEVINEKIEQLGEKSVLIKIKAILSQFYNDLSCIDPNLSAKLLDRFKKEI